MKRPAERGPRNGTSALLLAVENGHFELAVELLKAGADPNDQRAGFGALHMLSWVRKPDRGDSEFGTPPPNGSGIYSYTAMYLLKAVIEQVGTSRQAVRDALAEVGRGQPPFEGPLGPVAFDENGDLLDPRVYVGQVQDGRMVLAEGQ